MALPKSSTWDLVDFNAATFAEFASLSPADRVISPPETTAFQLNAALNGLVVRSSDGVPALLQLTTGMPARFSVQLVLRCPQLPHNLGDLHRRRFAITVADDAGRGFSLYLAKTGIAIGRIDNLGAVTALPETGDLTAAVAERYYTLRIAVDGALGRAYVFLGEGITEVPPLRFILPADATPATLGDLLRIEALGLPGEPVHVEVAQLQLGTGLALANYPPIADAGTDRAAPVGSAVRLDGRQSYDVEGAPLLYRWHCVDAPYGSLYALEHAEATTVDDGDADGFTPRITLAPSDIPAWLAAGDIVRFSGGTFEVDAVDADSGHVDLVDDDVPDAVSAPIRFIRQSILLDGESPTPTFVPDVAGVYRFRLVVSDGDNASEPSEVLVNVSPVTTPAGIEPDVTALWKAIGDEWRYVEGREILTDLWTGVAQVIAGKLMEAWQLHYNTSIRDVQRVYQKKWIAYRTMVYETRAADAVITPRYGGFLATYPFETAPSINLAGKSLAIELLEPGGSYRTITIDFTGAVGLDALCDILNFKLVVDEGVETLLAAPRGLRSVAGGRRLLIAGTDPFRLWGSAGAALGLPLSTYNRLGGLSGQCITDHTYYAEGTDLVRAGVTRGDLLVLNRGESFRIDRILSDPSDPHPNQRLLLFDALPLDATATWAIPSLIESAEVDYERAGAYPGDLAKTEVETGGAYTEEGSLVVAERGRVLAVDLGPHTMAALLDDAARVRFLGLKRRKAIPLPEDVVGVPTLQEIIPVSKDPALYREHVDYILEPFYRNEGAPTPMLQFRDEVFIHGGFEPPDVLWAEITLFDNEKNVESLFGRLVGFLRDDAKTFPKDFSYTAGVAGLLYAKQRGPSLFAMAVGAQILLGQPFAEVAGFVEEIRPTFSPAKGRILVRDDDGNRPTESDTVRAYYYRKNPSDLSETSGLAENPETGERWKVGDLIPQFSPIASGIELDDIYTKPNWWRTYAGGGAMHEVEKFHRFICTFDLRLVDIANMSLLASLLTRIKPRYTRLMLVGDTSRNDDLDVEDDLSVTVDLRPHDTLLAHRGARHDDYKGDGTLTAAYDDGITRYDELVDSIVESVQFVITVSWPGGTLALPNADWPFSLSEQVVDINGSQTGNAGSSFSLSNGMTLAAGTYRTSYVVRSGPLLPPL